MNIPGPGESSKSLGWNVDYKFLIKVQERIERMNFRDVITPDLEEIEAVLIALKNIERNK